MARSSSALSLLICTCLCVVATQSQTVLLAGATGKTGVLVYAELKQIQGVTVRALVRNATKAKALLGCNKCDESEGIFEGDVTKPDTLIAPSKGADVLVSALGSGAICTGHPGPSGIPACHYNKGAFPIDINWNGNKAMGVAFAQAGGSHMVLMSTAGTTEPDNFLDKLGHGFVSFYSLQAEAWLMGSGLDFTIVEPCGLSDGEPAKHKLVVAHSDELAFTTSIFRSDVARVLAAAVSEPKLSSGLRFDLCASKSGKPTVDVKEVFKEAAYPWAKDSLVV